jgi:hypothetical protein
LHHLGELLSGAEFARSLRLRESGQTRCQFIDAHTDFRRSSVCRPNLCYPPSLVNLPPYVLEISRLTVLLVEHRCALGFSFVSWSQLADVFRVGIVALMQSSFPQANPLSSTVNGSSFALISANFASLIKNIDRLNDLCIIARNMLATKEIAQDLAAKAKFENQVLMLIDTCVRVTARGCDGPIDGGDRQSQERWQKVVAACTFSYFSTCCRNLPTLPQSFVVCVSTESTGAEE